MILFLALGCHKAEEIDLGPRIDTEVMELRFDQTPNGTRVRAVNAQGVAVNGESIALVDVGELTEEVTLDEYGYGWISLATQGTEPLGGSDAEVHRTASWSGLGLLPAVVASDEVPIAAWGATEGALVASSTRLWWVESEAHVILDLPETEEILSVIVADIDHEDALDAVVITNRELVFLRGRPGGGMSGGTTMPGPFEAVTVGDISQDGTADVMISRAGEETATLEIWEGNGGFDFRLAASTDAVSFSSLTVANLVGTGENHLFAKNDTEVREYTSNGTGLREQEFSTYLEFNGDDQIENLGDHNGDGGDDLLVRPPLLPDGDRSFQIYYVMSDEYIYVEAPEHHSAMADVDANGTPDLAWVDFEGDLTLLLLSCDADGCSLGKHWAAALRGWGPIAATDADSDARTDLFQAGADAWAWYPPAAVSLRTWEAEVPEAMGLGVFGEVFAMAGDEVAVLASTEAGPELRIYALESATVPQLELTKAIVLEEGGAPIDAAICDEIAWVLLQGSTHRVNMNTGAIRSNDNLSATAIACGEGIEGVAAAVLNGTAIYLLDAQVEVLSDQPALGGDLAFVNSTVVDCGEESCSLAVWPWSDEGESSLVSITEATTTVTLSTGTRALSGGGQGFVGDLDADGRPDLITAGDGLVTVHRTTGEGIAPAEQFHGLSFAPWAVVDLTGDDRAEIVGFSEEGELVLTR